MGARPHRWQLAFSALVVAAGLLNMFRMQLPLNVIPSWDMPISYLFVAAFLVWGASMRSRLLPSPLRACAANAAKHAGATELRVSIATPDDGSLALEFTNDGQPPREEASETGGLVSLRRSVEAAGGAMYVEWTPSFAVRLIIPIQV